MNLESFTNYTTYNALYTSNERKESQKYENLPSPIYDRDGICN